VQVGSSLSIQLVSVHPETLVLTRRGLNCRGVIPQQVV
jgi:hypothetical protein